MCTYRTALSKRYINHFFVDQAREAESDFRKEQPVNDSDPAIYSTNI